MRATGPVAGIAGGACWVVRWVAGGGSGWTESLHWVGLGLLAVSLAVAGAGLVSRSAVPLRVLVAVALPLLVGSLWSAVRGSGDAVALDGVVGPLAVVTGAAALVLERRTTPEPAAPAATPARQRSGGHASR